MSSITSWTRLEPRTRNEDLARGLQGRVHDPLWFLARQHQLGEFTGEDAGSPVIARLAGTGARLTRYRPGGEGATPRPYSPAAVPLEALVEREGMGGQPGGRLWRAATGGLHFARMLEDRGIGAGVLELFRRQFPIAAATDDERRTMDRASLRYASVVAGRVVDGEALYAAMRRAFPPGGGGSLPAEPKVPAGDRSAVTAVVQAWLRWRDALVSVPEADAARTAWEPTRMEYRFDVAARVGDGEVALTVREYQDGRLDWYSFDALADGSLAAPPDPIPLAAEAIPARVRYHGMPSDRWWEFEDAEVDFGSLDAAPDDLARMVMVEYALVFGNDWFVMPFTMPVGSVCRVTSFVVTDTFGVETNVPCYTETQAESAPWRMFALSRDRLGAPGVAAAAPDLFFLPPTLGPGIEGPPVEELLLVRDETANVAWAVERVVEGPSGRPVSRQEASQDERGRAAPSASAPGSGAADATTLLYRLATDVPEYWFPLVPQPASGVGGAGAARLRRAVVANVLAGERAGDPRGRLLGELGARALFDEEVPRAGARVTCGYQYARWVDGSTLLWVGRRKGAGRGEAASGLRYDAVEPARSP